MRDIDEQGNVWEVDGSVRLLVEPTQAWREENQPYVEPLPPEPSMEDYLIDLDFRLCLMELGIGGM